MRPSRKRPSFWVILTISTFVAFVLWTTFIDPSFHLPLPAFSPLANPDRPAHLETDAPCAHLPGSEDVIVMFKTGGNSARKTVPVHLNTTFQCADREAIFSDVSDVIAGHEVIDVLADVPQSTKDDWPEFRTYEKMIDYKNKGFSNYTDLLHADIAEGTLRGDMPGWKLDKWKFMPMLERALEWDSKWYFFMETDTAVVWSNLLRWLAHLNPDLDWWIGSGSPAGELTFAHGGSGFVLSKSALKKAVDTMRANRWRYDELFGNDCCGDVKLGNLMADAGINILRSFKMLRGEPPGLMLWNQEVWCYPAVTYHHMGYGDIEELWELEQRWLSNETTKDKPMRHRDVFDGIIRPIIETEPIQNWDNWSNDVVITEEGVIAGEIDPSISHGAIENLDGCRGTCEKAQGCMQFVFEPGYCGLNFGLHLGTAVMEPEHEGRISGWIRSRMQGFIDSQEPCDPRWIVKNDS